MVGHVSTLIGLATGQRSFAYRGTKICNELSDDLKSLTSVKAFKGHVNVEPY